MSSPKVRVIRIGWFRLVLYTAVFVFLLVKTRLLVPFLLMAVGVPLAIGYGVYRMYRSALRSAEAARDAFERQTPGGPVPDKAPPVTIEICPKCGCEKTVCRC